MAIHKIVLSAISLVVLMTCLSPTGYAVDAPTDKVIKMSTTTSTQDSGLLDVLLPEFAKETGIQVKVIAKGTGAAIRDGIDGNVDIIFVHAKAKEEQFVADGFGTRRYAVMHNDFVIIGPETDPAGVKGLNSGIAALEKIAKTKSTFISRGDDSGTHSKEQEIWAATNVPMVTETREVVKNGKPAKTSFTHPDGLGQWYLSIGQGMGATLTMAAEKQAYTLTDRGTYIKFKDGRKQGLDLEIHCEGDASLRNDYGLIPVNPAKHPHVRLDLAQQFADWMMSAKGQSIIRDYAIFGKPLFFPDAIKK